MPSGLTLDFGTLTNTLDQQLQRVYRSLEQQHTSAAAWRDAFARAERSSLDSWLKSNLVEDRIYSYLSDHTSISYATIRSYCRTNNELRTCCRRFDRYITGMPDYIGRG